MYGLIGFQIMGHQLADEQKNDKQECFEYRTSTSVNTYQDSFLQLDFSSELMEQYLVFNGRFLVVLDGKIYNYKQLRSGLQKKGYIFDLGSEIEVIATLFVENGVEAFRELRGMFAIVIWDNQEKTLYAARDPFGIKPFYYMDSEELFHFSYHKSHITESNSNLTFHEQALQHYLSFQYVPVPLTLTKEIVSLQPGYFLIKSHKRPLQKQRYFHATFQPVDGNENQIINRIQEVMVDSVKAHIQDEDSVGAFLSGGIDSSLIVGIAKHIHPTLKTFSVGFEEDGFSEIPIAQKTASELNVENISYTISPQEYVGSLPTILRYLDDPLADPSCVPLYFVAKQASTHAKIVLSGEGADELFGGYNIYREFESLKLFNHLPSSMLKWLHKLSRVIPEGVPGRSFIERGTTPLKERYIGNAKIFEEKEKQQFLKSYNEANDYRFITDELFQYMKEEHPSHQMQYIDIHTWLPGDILLKADRMTRIHSLSLRSPFLDKEVFQVAQKIPVKYKISEKQTKQILRKAAKDFVPNHVVERRKLGFPVPIRKWLQNELFDWAQTVILISETDNYVDKSYCLKLLTDHAAGKRDNSRKLWTILVFMIWYQVNIANKE
ncbi:asparagine synthase (glutamine-hydrolyzing) [Paucisalibacillus globulus]|uniref:asparagine synthase (glutamine-hydrolyzing) n=1 Tax=Paucisalibacillus globulus TaxID=351095 RepID=UPI000403D128|nr:asparagine synthase (glutamine-hydrolyzing) [Paucisalibacillus globulus]